MNVRGEKERKERRERRDLCRCRSITYCFFTYCYYGRQPSILPSLICPSGWYVVRGSRLSPCPICAMLLDEFVGGTAGFLVDEPQSSQLLPVKGTIGCASNVPLHRPIVRGSLRHAACEKPLDEALERLSDQPLCHQHPVL